jgi:diguanylate cyclase (GGDEF)-like protein
VISELLAAAGGVSVAAVPAGLALSWMRGRLDRARIECKAARYDATHDALTGLLNRAGVDAAMTARADSGRAWSLVMVDLDGFKQVNDTFGHDAGDEVLIEASFRLFTEFSQAGDQVGRLGGDEFVVLTDDGPDEPGRTYSTTWLRALHALSALRAAPVELAAGQQVTVSASVGVVSVLAGAELGRVKRSADIAVYRAKARGGDMVVEYGLPGELATVLAHRPARRLRDNHPHQVPAEYRAVIAR